MQLSWIAPVVGVSSVSTTEGASPAASRVTVAPVGASTSVTHRLVHTRLRSRSTARLAKPVAGDGPAADASAVGERSAVSVCRSGVAVAVLASAPTASRPATRAGDARRTKGRAMVVPPGAPSLRRASPERWARHYSSRPTVTGGGGNLGERAVEAAVKLQL